MMNRQIGASLLCLLLLCAGQTAQAQGTASRAAAQRAQVNPRALTGTYRSGRSEWLVQSLGGNRLRVQFSGVYAYRMPSGEWTSNVGEAAGIVTLNGNTAVFVPEGFDDCRITLRFAGRRLIVNQTGMDAYCGFGHNVYASGTYIKRSSRPPRFAEN